MFFGLFLMFVLGIGNFALHRAVLESGHPLIGQIPHSIGWLGRRVTLVVEFAVLLIAMLLTANGWSALAWAYAAYTGLNGLAAWLILTGRV